MLNKIAEFTLDKRLREMEDRIAKMGKKLQDNTKTPPRRK